VIELFTQKPDFGKYVDIDETDSKLVAKFLEIIFKIVNDHGLLNI